MNPITINQLKKQCEIEILKGNGDNVIMISSDDEGNGFHYLWYGFQEVKKFEEEFEYQGKKYQFDFEYCDETIAKKEDTITLG